MPNVTQHRVAHPGGFYWHTVRPAGVDRCTVRTGGAYRSMPRGSPAGRLAGWFSRTAGYGYSLPDFLPEDKATCERGQRGASGDFNPGRLVPAERVVADFGHYLDWRLNDIDPPAVQMEVLADIP